jgi:hypothetical protein
MAPTVDLLQAVHHEPYDVSLGTPSNRTLIEEINANWSDGSTGHLAASPYVAHIASPLEDMQFYDALETEPVKDQPTDW